MTPARWVNLALIVQYALLTLFYGLEREWPKALYWGGAILLSLGVLLA